MTFARLTRGDWLAAVAALALLLVMAADWYSTEAAEQARRDAEQAVPQGPVSGEVARDVDDNAQIIRNRHEKNAWQAGAFADRVILLMLLAAVGLALAAAALRAADRRFRPPWTPSALATGVGLAALILLAARIIQKPAVDAGAVVKLGAPLGVVCVGALAIGARLAWNAERDGSVWAERTSAPPGDTDEPAGADTPGSGAITRPAALFDDADAAPAGATAVVAPPAPPEPQPEVMQPPPEQGRLAPADDSSWAPDWDDPSAAERERRRVYRAQRRGGDHAPKRPRWPFRR